MIGRLALLLLCAGAVPATPANGESHLWAGAGEAEITPPPGAPLVGSLVPSTGVHDPLWARALVIGDVNLLAVGDEFCLVTMTHEVFAEYQLWIDRSAPFRHTMVLAYTNGCESYIPTDRDFALGGYEAAAFPAAGAAALSYRKRVALKPGIEQQIKQQVQALWSR